MNNQLVKKNTCIDAKRLRGMSSEDRFALMVISRNGMKITKPRPSKM